MNYSGVTILVDGRAVDIRVSGPNPAEEDIVIVAPAKATWARKMPKNKKKFGPTTTGKNRKGLVQPPRADIPSTASSTSPPLITKQPKRKIRRDAKIKSNLVLLINQLQ